jgi:hypothetical protein
LAFSYWIDNLGFVLREKLAAILIKPSLGVPNWPVIYFINYMPPSSLEPFITVPSKAITAIQSNIGSFGNGDANTGVVDNICFSSLKAVLACVVQTNVSDFFIS